MTLLFLNNEPRAMGAAKSVVGKRLCEERQMTKLLKKAFKRASELSEAEQDALAKLILAEIEAEKVWDRLFASSAHVLEKMAEDAMTEHKARKTQELDLERF